MWRVIAIAAILLVSLGASADAAERRIGAVESYSVSTYRGWVLWEEATGGGLSPVLWRGGSRRAFEPVETVQSGYGSIRLGSDSRGRTVVVYVRCAHAGVPGGHPARDCALVRHRLPDHSENVLLRAAEGTDLSAPELSDGRLVVGRIDPTRRGRQRSMYLIRPGPRDRRLSLDDPEVVDLVGERLVYAAGREGTGSRDSFDAGVVRAIDLGPRRPRYRTLAKHDNSDVDGRVPGFSIVSYYGAASDGRYAYWVKETARDSPNVSSWEILRADLTDANASLSRLPLERSVSSIAISKGRLYYTSKYNGGYGVWEITDPVWQATALHTPLEH